MTSDDHSLPVVNVPIFESGVGSRADFLREPVDGPFVKVVTARSVLRTQCRAIVLCLICFAVVWRDRDAECEFYEV